MGVGFTAWLGLREAAHHRAYRWATQSEATAACALAARISCPQCGDGQPAYRCTSDRSNGRLADHIRRIALYAVDEPAAQITGESTRDPQRLPIIVSLPDRRPKVFRNILWLLLLQQHGTRFCCPATG